MWLNRYYPFRPGDLLLVDNSGDQDVVSAVGTHILSNGIEVLTGGDYSHSLLVIDPAYVPGGIAGSQLVWECTIRNGVDGCQVNSLPMRVEECDGPSVWAFPMRDDIRVACDFDAMWKLAMSKVGHEKYSKRGVLNYILRLFDPWSECLRKKVLGEGVCSEEICELLQEGLPQIPEVSKANAVTCSPLGLQQFPIWWKPTQIWNGELP